MLLIANRVAGDHVLEAHRGADVAGQNLGDLLALVGVHLDQASDALAAGLGNVVNRFARGQFSRINPDKCQLTDKRIGHDLEHQRRERLGVIGLTLDHDFFIVHRVAANGRHIQRRRQVIHHRVQKILDTLVLERRPAHYGENLLRDGGLANPRAQFVFGDGRAFHVLGEQVVVGFRYRLHQLVVILLGQTGELFRNFDVVELGAQRLVQPHARFHGDQVDHAREPLFGADGKLDRHRPALQPVDDGIKGTREIRAHPVHFVDEADPRNVILIALPPHRFSLRLHARHRVEHRHGPIQHTQAAFHLSREIHVARRVDDVDGAVVPFAGGRGRGDGDAALLLLLHPVHHGRAFVHFADLVGPARVVQNTLRRRRLTGVDMRHDADVAHLVELYCASHKS